VAEGDMRQMPKVKRATRTPPASPSTHGGCFLTKATASAVLAAMGEATGLMIGCGAVSAWPWASTVSGDCVSFSKERLLLSRGKFSARAARSVALDGASRGPMLDDLPPTPDKGRGAVRGGLESDRRLEGGPTVDEGGNDCELGPPSELPRPPMAAGLRRGISCSGGTGIGSCVQGPSASSTSIGVAYRSLGSLDIIFSTMAAISSG